VEPIGLLWGGYKKLSFCSFNSENIAGGTAKLFYSIENKHDFEETV